MLSSWPFCPAPCRHWCPHEKIKSSRVVTCQQAVFCARSVRAVEPARLRHGVSVLRGVAVHDGARQRRLSVESGGRIVGRCDPTAGPSEARAGGIGNAYYLGPYSEYFLDAGGHTLRAQRSLPLDATLGQRLYARVAPEHCLVVADPSADGAGVE